MRPSLWGLSTLVILFCTGFMDPSQDRSVFPDLPEPKLFAQSCRIRVESPAQGDLLCSGTIVGTRHVLTAAHCLPPDATRVEVSCKGDRPVRVARRWEVPPAYFQRQLAARLSATPRLVLNQGRGEDVGLVTFAVPFDSAPVALPASRAEAERLTWEQGDCQVQGYGGPPRERQHRGTVVSLYLGEPGTIDRLYLEAELHRLLTLGRPGGGGVAPSHLVEQGDSGAGVICRSPRGPVVLGVVRGETVVTAVSHQLEWIAAALSRPGLTGRQAISMGGMAFSGRPGGEARSLGASSSVLDSRDGRATGGRTMKHLSTVLIFSFVFALALFSTARGQALTPSDDSAKFATAQFRNDPRN